MFYNHQKAKSFCEYQGLRYDEQQAAIADAMLYKAGLSQDSFDAAMSLHISEVKRLFTPSTYTFKQRLFIGAYFIFNLRFPSKK